MALCPILESWSEHLDVSRSTISHCEFSGTNIMICQHWQALQQHNRVLSFYTNIDEFYTDIIELYPFIIRSNLEMVVVHCCTTIVRRLWGFSAIHNLDMVVCIVAPPLSIDIIFILSIPLMHKRWHRSCLDFSHWWSFKRCTVFRWLCALLRHHCRTIQGTFRCHTFSDDYVHCCAATVRWPQWGSFSNLSSSCSRTSWFSCSWR